MIYKLKQLILKWIHRNSCKVCFPYLLGSCNFCAPISKKRAMEIVKSMRDDLKAYKGTPMTEDEKALLNRAFEE